MWISSHEKRSYNGYQPENKSKSHKPYCNGLYLNEESRYPLDLIALPNCLSTTRQTSSQKPCNHHFTPNTAHPCTFSHLQPIPRPSSTTWFMPTNIHLQRSPNNKNEKKRRNANENATTDYLPTHAPHSNNTTNSTTLRPPTSPHSLTKCTLTDIFSTIHKPHHNPNHAHTHLANTTVNILCAAHLYPTKLNRPNNRSTHTHPQTNPNTSSSDPRLTSVHNKRMTQQTARRRETKTTSILKQQNKTKIQKFGPSPNPPEDSKTKSKRKNDKKTQKPKATRSKSKTCFHTAIPNKNSSSSPIEKCFQH